MEIAITKVTKLILPNNILLLVFWLAKNIKRSNTNRTAKIKKSLNILTRINDAFAISTLLDIYKIVDKLISEKIIPRPNPFNQLLLIFKKNSNRITIIQFILNHHCHIFFIFMTTLF